MIMKKLFENNEFLISIFKILKEIQMPIYHHLELILTEEVG